MTQDEFDNFSLNLLEKDFFANEKKTMQIKGYFFDDMMQEIDIIIKNKFISKKARLSKISNIKSRMVCNITETSSIREIRNLQAKSISDTLVHLLTKCEKKDIHSYMLNLCAKIKSLKLIKDFTDLSSINTNRIAKTVELCFCLHLNTKSYEEDTFFNVSFLSSERI